MFDVGFWEILLILVLALVVIGPERLPGAARRAGYFVGKARRFIEGARSEFEAEFDVNELKRVLHNQEVQINELQQQLETSVNDIKPDLAEDDRSAPEAGTNNSQNNQSADDSHSGATANQQKS